MKLGENDPTHTFMKLAKYQFHLGKNYDQIVSSSTSELVEI